MICHFTSILCFFSVSWRSAIDPCHFHYICVRVRMCCWYDVVKHVQGSSAVENGVVSDHEQKPEEEAETQTEANADESNTREPSLPPSTAG